ncbi:PAQR family membrane homeostasis protein TrhA [Litorihabitans aurantiacus]|uniref:DNA-binding protein n=1 Tax=Litorihabitans aurantiacus TaxID=1930061 RepID=A0AA37XAZ4_9MICO|nr:hemolysin III family protein [Litorihabitans aurantiacus]GMA30539.1 DNA-binding protein [Litorihabitans aurantiacus]
MRASTSPTPAPARGRGDGRKDRPTVESAVEQLASAVKPLLRGWIHAGMFPFVLAAGIVLVALSPTSQARWSTLVFAAATSLLFGASAVYHRGTWEPRTLAILRRIDHSNIFLVIAGTYTPLAALLLPPGQARTLLLVVWIGAGAGILARVFWLGAPRWLYVPIYLALSWVAVWFLPSFGRSGGGAVMWLVIAGGIGYTLGAVVYALKRPNPSPRWFGFHEIFHVGTLIGYTCHAIAIFITVASLR